VAMSKAMASGWKNEGIFVKSGPKIARAVLSIREDGIS
jgi:hypothetical protein